ncbi:epoxide hydrolase [Microbispora hainanensis]|uniref:epoxide hydrolase family protein n=1 Tax=Microbispora TaxID=2005 RepID=UPI00115BC4EB|nr:MULTISPECIES: epoxide hydrolase family protein [Microbispora]NJP28996.1 epoxide hydrolase [Microbispora sp. CL1-1]TQS06595.1 epoxide hydrolase [Microbispora sp. SCL1-1]
MQADTARHDGVQPFHIHIPDSALADLRERLARVRLPDQETVPDAAQGVQLGRLRELLHHWATKYDWRTIERHLNDLGQFRTTIDGQGIHFTHVRSPHQNATPLLLLHGWPGSFLEFLKVIGPLTDPVAHGGDARDAFHVVVPSMPGYGFSDIPSTGGWTPDRIAAAYAVLMRRLGYDSYLAQGGDWGGVVATRMGKQRPDGLRAVHLNFPEFLALPPVGDEPTREEAAALAQGEAFARVHSGYHLLQRTRPQTIGYALTDSPAGQAAWIYEKFLDWAAPGAFTLDEMLDHISLYWLTGTATSSARLYWEYAQEPLGLTELDLPVGVSVFPNELTRTPRIWAERAFHDLRYFNDDIPAGGHFAAFEQPGLFVEEVRAFARAIGESA